MASTAGVVACPHIARPTGHTAADADPHVRVRRTAAKGARACGSLHGYVYKNGGKGGVFNIQAAEKPQPSMNANYSAEQENLRRREIKRLRRRSISCAFARVCSTFNRRMINASGPAVEYAVREIKELRKRYKNSRRAGLASGDTTGMGIFTNQADPSFILEVVYRLARELEKLELSHDSLIIVDAMKFFSESVIPPPEPLPNGKEMSPPSSAVATHAANGAVHPTTIGNLNETRQLIVGLVARARAAESSAAAILSVVDNEVGFFERAGNTQKIRRIMNTFMRTCFRWYNNPAAVVANGTVVYNILSQLRPNCAAAVARTLATHCWEKYERYLRH